MFLRPLPLRGGFPAQRATVWTVFLTAATAKCCFSDLFSATANAVLNTESFKAYKDAHKEIRFVTDIKEFEAVAAITGKEGIMARESDCAELIRTQAYAYDNNADNLVYIREAVELRA